MKIIVDSLETLNALATVCSNALATKDLRVAKTALLIIESATIEEKGETDAVDEPD